MLEDFLLELGVEELPAYYIKPAAIELAGNLSSIFRERNIHFGKMKVFFTPRRIAVLFKKLEDYEEKKQRRVYGPPAERAFDDDGKPTPAAFGFTKSYNKTFKDLKIGERKDKKICFLEIEEEPKQTKTILKTLLPSVLANLSFPKKMKWEQSKFEFARPIRWLVLLFGKKGIRFKIAGVTSSKVSYGPRFLGSKRIAIKDASSYKRVMKKNYVIASFDERKKMIKRSISKLLGMNEVVKEDNELINEVANLIEYPTPFKGEFDKEFLSLPQDVLITAMREHQRYFAVLDKKGKIKPIYIGISNSLDDNIEEITKNNNGVLRARLNDAKFYWLEDLKKPFGDRIQELKGIEWHRGLGTVFDKTMRLVLLSLYFKNVLKRGEKEILKRGALLSKVDLVTEMIKDGKEFTKLEGIIGREYALRFNERKEVASIISEHYLPRTPQDGIPKTIESAIVGVSDRLDTLVGNFIVGEVPTGSIDPFGLRRSANGIIKILDGFKMHFSIKEMIAKSIFIYLSQENVNDVDSKKIIDNLKEFLLNRLVTYLSSLGIRYDIANAVFFIGIDDIYEMIERIRFLNKEKDNETFKNLVLGQRRVANILVGLEIENLKVDEELFNCEAEKILWENCKKTKDKFYELLSEHNYRKGLLSLLSFCPHIDSFFDKCLVMTKDVERKNNRLGMLKGIKELFDSYADFSKIVLLGEKDDNRSGGEH